VEWAEGALSKLYSAIGANIRTARERRRWSQTALATEVGLTRSSIANIEAGRQRMPVHTLVLIGNALGVSVGSLLPTPYEVQSLTQATLPAPDLTGHTNSTRQFITAALRQAGEDEK
jgi:transcriptional regulator with XRE-family HTH domain